MLVMSLTVCHGNVERIPLKALIESNLPPCCTRIHHQLGVFMLWEGHLCVLMLASKWKRFGFTGRLQSRQTQKTTTAASKQASISMRVGCTCKKGTHRFRLP